MKKLILSLAIISLGVAALAQTDPIDDLFRKYSDQEGFTVVTISGKMFSMFSDLNEDKSAEGDVIKKLKSIRILSSDNAEINKNVNFYTELSKKMDFSAYEELMVVKEGSEVTKFLVKQSGENISELVVISGGGSGNSLISIRGDLDMKSLSNISRDIGLQDLDGLDKIDQKPGKADHK